MKMKTPYETLGVQKTASQEEIKSAYRKLAKQFHPDLNPGNSSAESRFKEINSAYETIGTSEARNKFDQEAAEKAQYRERGGPFYHETQAGGGRYSQTSNGMDEEMLRSIFEQMGRQGGRGHRGPINVRGHDVFYQMEVAFQDVALGAEREITLPSGKKLRVKIPAGVDSGTKLRFAGLGTPGEGEAPAGDAYVELNVTPSALFKRKGSDVEMELPISITEAVLGAEVHVPTIDGPVMMKIPSGVSSGAKLRLTGKGVVNSDGTRGDQHVVLKLVSPARPDQEIKQAMKLWSARQIFDPRAGWIGVQGGRS